MPGQHIAQYDQHDQHDLPLVFCSEKQREVICGDAVEWLTLVSSADGVVPSSPKPSLPNLPGSVFTAVPDVKDVPRFNSIKDVQHRTNLYVEWFNTIVETIFCRLSAGQVAIFSQTDARLIDTTSGAVLGWIDKSHLCCSAAEKHGCTLLWHKIALAEETSENEKGGGSSIGYNSSSNGTRPSFTHLICFGKGFCYHVGQFRTPDVISRGPMTWLKATGLHSCLLGVSFLKHIVHTPLVVNPFCGQGTVLAVANALGLPALGVEICPKRARQAQARTLLAAIAAVPMQQLRQLGVRPEEFYAAAHTSTSTITSTGTSTSTGTVTDTPHTDSSTVPESHNDVDDGKIM